MIKQPKKHKFKPGTKVDPDEPPLLITNFEVLQKLQSAWMSRFPDWEQFQDDVRKHKKVADKAWKVKKNEGRNISMLSAKARVKVEKTLAAGSESQAYLRKLKTQENSIWIRETALKFISRMPAANQTEKSIALFIKRLREMDGVSLSAGEVQLLIDLQPQTSVEVHRIIEEIEERVTEEQIQKILQLIRDTLPMPPTWDESDNEADEEQEGEAEDDVDMGRNDLNAPHESDQGHDSELSENDLISDDRGTFSRRQKSESSD